MRQGFKYIRRPTRVVATNLVTSLLVYLLLGATAVAQSTPPAQTATAPTAAASPITQAMAAAQSRALATQQDIERYLQDTSNVQWLTQGDNEKFLMLYRADQSGKSLGLALLLHGEQQHPAAGPILETLRTQLPEHGWATLSLGFLHDSDLMRFVEDAQLKQRQQPSANAPTNNNNANNNNNNNNNNPAPASAQLTVPAFEELSDIGKNFQQRLIAALPVINEKAPMHIVVVAFDISVLWFFESIDAGMDLPGLGSVVMIDGYQPDGYKNFDLIQSTISSNFGLLDVAVSHPDAQVQSQLRRIRARQRQRDNYRYIKLNHTLSSASNKAQLTRRISSWLRRQIEKK